MSKVIFNLKPILVYRSKVFANLGNAMKIFEANDPNFERNFNLAISKFLQPISVTKTRQVIL